MPALRAVLDMVKGARIVSVKVIAYPRAKVFLPSDRTSNKAMRFPSPVLSYASAKVNAPKISHTVGLENPETAHSNALTVGLNPGWANSSELNRTYGPNRAATEIPINPMAPPGRGSKISPTIHPKKMAKNLHAWGSSPRGTGMIRMINVARIGHKQRRALFIP